MMMHDFLQDMEYIDYVWHNAIIIKSTHIVFGSSSIGNQEVQIDEKMVVLLFPR